jgi:uncharacterized protein
MKSSKYNNFLDYDGKKIGFNAFTTEYIVLDTELYFLLEAAIQEEEINSLAEIHREFYDFMIEKGFFVEDDTDELLRVKQLVESIDNNNQLYQLHINPTMNCNFKCWYCYETHIKDSKMSEDIINAVLAHTRHVIDSNKELRNFTLFWFGGEPLLYFERVLHPLLKNIYQQLAENNIGFRCGITTNGLLVNENVIKIAKSYNLHSFQITLDGNREQHDKVRFIKEGIGSYDKIVNNIKLLAFHNLNVYIRINVSEKTLVGLDDILNDFINVCEEDKKHISFSFHQVWQVEVDLEDEITKYRNVFRQSGYKVGYGDIDSVRDSCYGDRRNHATINYNGDVFKCTARDFSGSNREGTLTETGQIDWNNKYEERMNVKFKNKPCLSCSIMPICNGGCSQQAIEHIGVDYCVHDFDELKKKNLVLNRFLSTAII